MKGQGLTADTSERQLIFHYPIRTHIRRPALSSRVPYLAPPGTLLSTSDEIARKPKRRTDYRTGP